MKKLCSCAVLTPLQMALAVNSLGVAAVLLREGADVNAFDARECLKVEACRISEGPVSYGHHCPLSSQDLGAASSPLKIAALSRNVSMGRLLLKLGARVNLSGGSGTALQVAAAQRHNLAFVRLLLDNGADVNASASEPRGRTALQAAVELGDGEIIGTLLHHRANVNAIPSSEGVTALQAAAFRGDTLLVSQLICQGADINALAALNNGRTALQAAVTAGHLNTVEPLIRKGANIFAQRAALTGGCSALEAAMNQPLVLETLLCHTRAQEKYAMLEREQIGVFWSAIDCDNYHDVTAVLLKYGIKLYEKDLRRSLQIAIKRRNLDLAKKWIDAGASVQIYLSTQSWSSAIADLVATGSPAFCALFIRSPADLGEYGTEALLFAISNADLCMLEFLLSRGANPNWNDSYKTNRPSPVAKVFELRSPSEDLGLLRRNQEKMICILLQHGAKVKSVAFPGEVCGMSLQMLKRLLEAGLEVNRRLPDQDSLLQYATKNHMKDVVELLLDADADVNAPPPATELGKTALQSAVQSRDLRLIKLLLSKGADVNAPPSPGCGATALHRAVLGGSLPIFSVLIKKGADVNAPAASDDGRTALEAAAEHGRLDMAHILLRRDKDPDTLWLRSQRAAKLAASRGFPILARELREWKV